MATTTSEKTKLVESYTKNRYILFPCGHPKKVNPDGSVTPPKSKAPRKGWQGTVYNAGLKASDLPPVYGVLLRADDFILDVDPRRFPENDNVLSRLWEKLGLPTPIETFMTNTISGGIHIYFKKDPSINVVRDLKSLGFPGIEVKSLGQLVVAAGSQIGDGEYTVKRSSPSIVMTVPEKLLTFCTRVQYCDLEDMDPVEEEDAGSIWRYKLFLARHKGTVLGQGSNNETFAVASEGKDYGLGIDTVSELMLADWNPKCVPEWPEAKLRTVVSNAFSYGQTPQGRLHPTNDFKGFLIPSRVESYSAPLLVNGRPYKILWDINYTKGVKELKSTLTNALNFFIMPELGDKPNPLVGLLRYNLFSNNIEFSRPAPWHDRHSRHSVWDDSDSVMLKLFLAKECHFHVGSELLENSVVAVAQLYKYHPVREWLDSLNWDGIPRLDSLLHRYAKSANTPYSREVGKNTIIALVARVMDPGCQHDHMLVLEGAQGSGKTSFCRTIGGPFYADFHLDPNNKDTVDAMQGSWVIEASEMSLTRKSDIDSLKAFLTRTTDRVRLSYGRHSKNFPRQCGFIGTVNPEEGVGYLRDVTGNRRFWPIGTGKFDLEALSRDRSQIFAEAVVRYHKGERHHIVDKVIEAMATGEQRKRVSQDAWVESIQLWLASTENEDIIKRMGGMKNNTIAYCALNIPVGRIGPTEQKRITQAMMTLGYYKGLDGVWKEDLTQGI